VKFWIGKRLGDVMGHKGKSQYLLESIGNTEEEADGMASFLAGFSGYEVVQVELTEVKKKPKPEKWEP